MASGPRSCRLFRETGCWGGWKRESGNEFANAFVLLRAHVVWRKRPRRRLKAVFYCWSANTYRLIKSFGLQEEIPKLWWWFRFRLWKRMWVKQSAVWILPSVSEQWSLAKPRNEPWKVDDRTQNIFLRKSVSRFTGLLSREEIFAMYFFSLPSTKDRRGLELFVT